MPDTLSAAHKKRLALFLDGTWNEVSDKTNIWRLRSLFAQIGSDGREQRAYYSKTAREHSETAHTKSGQQPKELNRFFKEPAI
jgi:hypothetical protein